MKVTFTFDKETRSLCMTSEDELEDLALNEMEKRCQKGAQIKLSRVNNNPKEFKFELRVNGFPGKVIHGDD